MQKKRDADAIARHKQFIANAIEDIGIKHNQHEYYLKDELTASTVMVNNAKKLIQQDEMKKSKDKEQLKYFQDIIYQENIDNITRKQKAKLDSFVEDKYVFKVFQTDGFFILMFSWCLLFFSCVFFVVLRRIFAEQEYQRQQEKLRYDQEMAERLKRTSEGPAHHIVMVSNPPSQPPI